MNNIPKQYLIVGGVIIIIVIAAIAIITTQGKNNNSAKEKETVFEEPAEVIPTVDSSVSVEIEGNTEGTITVEGIPAGTEEIEYELVYDTKAGQPEGAFGKIDVKKGSTSTEEEITFGTCSSGVCRYHEIVGSVKGTFKFSGSYGERLLEKEFDL